MASRLSVPGADQTLPGRESELPGIPERHAVLDAPLKPPFGDGVRTAVFGLFVVLDFNRLRRAGQQEVIPLAAGIFLTVFNVFLFFLQIFGGNR